MKYLFCLTFLFSWIFSSSQTELDNRLIIKAVVHHTKPSKYKVHPFYINKFFIEKIEDIKLARNIIYLEDSPRSEYRRLVTNDIIQLEKYNISYSKSVTILDSMNKKEIPKIKKRIFYKGNIVLSSPIYTTNGDIAIVFVEFLNKQHCGMGSYFIMEKKQGQWVFKESLINAIY